MRKKARGVAKYMSFVIHHNTCQGQQTSSEWSQVLRQWRQLLVSLWPHLMLHKLP